MRIVTQEEIMDIEISVGEKEYVVCHNNNYFKMGILEGKLFEAIYNGIELEEIQKKFNLSIEEVNQFVDILRKNNIIGTPAKKKNNIFFFRIPLFSADKIATNVAEFIYKHFIAFKILFILFNITIIAGLAAFMINYREFLNFEYIKLYGVQYVILYIALALSIFLHEFSHGLTCKLLGCKVGKIGFILIFFTPAFYCDISGIRMTHDKRKQILTALAGVYMNLFLMSTSALFYISTNINLFASFSLMQLTFIISNIIPIIKLDGYWVLSFATGITNLYQKSIKGVHYIWNGKNKTERFIGVYGLITWIVIIFSIANMILFIIQILISKLLVF